MKRISAEAYQALREALSAITWNKKAFETTTRTLLRDSPEILAGLNFNEPKRQVADGIVDRLLSDERRYQETTLALMVEIAGMTRFPNVEAIKDEPDRTLRLSQAQAAVAQLRALTKGFAAETAQREKRLAKIEADRLKADAARRFADEVDHLKQRFLAMQTATDHQQRGRDLEPLLTELFRLFDMEPRLSYSLELEQIDGSLNFDTDDYIVEARWRQERVSRGDADVFAAKVRRKGKERARGHDERLGIHPACHRPVPGIDALRRYGWWRSLHVP